MYFYEDAVVPLVTEEAIRDDYLGRQHAASSCISNSTWSNELIDEPQPRHFLRKNSKSRRNYYDSCL